MSEVNKETERLYILCESKSQEDILKGMQRGYVTLGLLIPLINSLIKKKGKMLKREMTFDPDTKGEKGTWDFRIYIEFETKGGKVRQKTLVALGINTRQIQKQWKQ